MTDSDVVPLPWCYNHGGRPETGLITTSRTGDCVVRAITIASGLPYKHVYDSLGAAQAHFWRTSKSRTASRSTLEAVSNIDRGVYDPVYKPYLASLGFTWHPAMQFGQGCRVHLRVGELPMGRLVVRLSRHLCAVIDGVIHDTYDCSRLGFRCVYGYWTAPDSSVSAP